MTPEQIAKSSEHSHQAAFFCWCQQNSQACWPLKYVFAVPNGGKRDKREAGRLKAEGVRAGVPDVFFPYPVNWGTPNAKAGLWLEFKKPGQKTLKTGGMSEAQIEYEKFLKFCNYEHKVVYSWLQATEEVLDYLSK